MERIDLVGFEFERFDVGDFLIKLLWLECRERTWTNLDVVLFTPLLKLPPDEGCKVLIDLKIPNKPSKSVILSLDCLSLDCLAELIVVVKGWGLRCTCFNPCLVVVDKLVLIKDALKLFIT